MSAIGVLVSGCASPRISLPEGRGTPLASYDDLFADATRACRQIRTMELMLAISGRAGEASLRGRVRGAVARPGSLRLEGLAPFGAPGFILVADPMSAVLLLPRDRRIVTGATAEELLAALTGVSLGPADFQAVLTGCLVPEPRPRSARSYPGDWVGLDVGDGAMLYVRPGDTGPLVVAGTRGGLVVEYRDHVRGVPRTVHVRSISSAVAETELTAELSQVNINLELHPAAFVAQREDGYLPMTLEELRGGVGPLEERGPAER